MQKQLSVCGSDLYYQGSWLNQVIGLGIEALFKIGYSTPSDGNEEKRENGFLL